MFGYVKYSEFEFEADRSHIVTGKDLLGFSPHVRNSTAARDGVTSGGFFPYTNGVAL